MSITVTTASIGERRNQKFRADASEVLNALRARIAGVLGELGTFSRPAEVQKALQLDKTLGRQVFKLASTAETLGSGGVVPSRTSMGRFIEAAKVRGIGPDSLDGVWSAYEVFEKLIETHAGDRATFNSMVSAASGSDEEWFAADAQHRRNAFRAMSHTLGIQAKAHLQLSIVNQDFDTGLFDIAMVSGLYGLRVLRPMSRVRVFSHILASGQNGEDVTREPLGLSSLADGHLLEDYSSQPLPNIVVSDDSNESGQWREVALDHPEIGNTGTCNLLFGTTYRGLQSENQPLNIHAVCNRPIEVLLFDVLKRPTRRPGAGPTGKATLGNNAKFGPEILSLNGKFEPEYLGKGPGAFATPEIPRYPQLLDTVAGKLDWDIKQFDAWRIRLEFPVYQSNVTMSWPDEDDE